MAFAVVVNGERHEVDVPTEMPADRHSGLKST